MWTTKQSPQQGLARAKDSLARTKDIVDRYKKLLPKTKRFVWHKVGDDRVCWDSKDAEYVDDDICELE